MAYIDLLLPVDLAYGSSGGPRFRTDVIVTNGGEESRNRVWEFDLAQYQCAYTNRLPVFWQEMLAFFRIMGGRANSFRARDPLDYEATTAEGTFIATDVATEWQMVKSYTIGAETAYRIVTKPRATVTAAAGTIDYATGIVTNATMPASWSGLFDRHARFDVDEILPEITNRNLGTGLIVTWQPLPVVEVRG